MSRRVLIVDDDREMCELLGDRLRRRGFQLVWRLSAVEAFDLLAQEEFGAVVTDIKMAQMNGLDLCQRIGVNYPHLPVIVITAFGNLESAVASIRAGAYDFLTKPFEIEMLALRLERAIEHRRLREQIKRLHSEAGAAREPDGLFGSSSAMERVRELLTRFHDSEAPVLITGETGTGKEIVARAIHRRSARAGAPFLAVNCAALPEALLEAELFGHTRGAFTDARTERTGLLLSAGAGTVLLDEVGDMPLALQPKLLRVLEERRVRPLGASAEVPFDARIIAATHRDLESAVEEGRFRADLLFRLDVLRVELPPLRARGSDVLLLAQHFTEQFAARSGKRVTGLSQGAAEKLLHYAWPGNVRELRNCIERAVALTRHEQLIVEDLPERVRNYGPNHVLVASDDPSELVPLDVVERRYVARVLEAVGGNKTLAARILGLDRKTLYRKLEPRDGAH
jgi:two-component system response regulator HydG